MSNDRDPIDDLANAGNGSRRYAYAMIAAVVLLSVGAGAGFTAFRATSTFADDKIAPVEKKVIEVEKKADATAQEFATHKRVQEETDKQVIEALRKLSEQLATQSDKLDALKERCIEGGGCSSRSRKDR